MNLDSESIISLVKEIDKNLENVDNVDIILAPSFPYLSLVSDLIKDTRINLSSQMFFMKIRAHLLEKFLILCCKM